jgi:FMN-dependent NADH-azoreductase
VSITAHIVPPGASEGPLTGKQVVVAVARGGAYWPGPPRADSDHQIPYSRSAFGQIGMSDELTFLICEMTHADTIPALAQFKSIAEASRKEAERLARCLVDDK